MKVCYVDETGNNSRDSCLIMTGVLLDATRLHKTQRELQKQYSRIAESFPGNLEELKGAKLVNRKGGWNHLSMTEWLEVVGALCSFVQARRHSIVLAAVDRSKQQDSGMDGVPDVLQDEWLAAGLHIALQIQRMNKDTRANKGHTFLIFDDNKKKADRLSELLWDPPEWTDDYYQAKKKPTQRLDQIINTPFAIKSQHETLVQLADVYAAILRRHVELWQARSTESWEGEGEQIHRWSIQLAQSLLPRSHRWPVRPRGDCSAWYNSVAPNALISLEG